MKLVVGAAQIDTNSLASDDAAVSFLSWWWILCGLSFEVWKVHSTIEIRKQLLIQYHSRLFLCNFFLFCTESENYIWQTRAIEMIDSEMKHEGREKKKTATLEWQRTNYRHHRYALCEVFTIATEISGLCTQLAASVGVYMGCQTVQEWLVFSCVHRTIQVADLMIFFQFNTIAGHPTVQVVEPIKRERYNLI